MPRKEEEIILFKLDETYICNTRMSSLNKSLQWVHEAASLGVTRQRHEADYSFSSGAEVKNSGSTRIPPLLHTSS
jgi:hypothetical protein